MLENLSMADFAPHHRSPFRLALDPDPNIVLVLNEIQALKDLRRGADGTAVPGVQAFSLLFHGPLTPILPQAIYPLENAAMGRLEIFIVPLGPDKEGMRYQAIFY